MKALLIASALMAQMGNAPAEMKYRDFLIRETRYVWGMDAEVSTFAAQIRQESGWDSQARSSHAAGLAQFTPATAGWMTRAFPELSDGGGNPASMPLNGKWAIRAMVRYDLYLYNQIPGGRPDRMALALRSYNGGPGWIFRELKGCRRPDMKCCRRFRPKQSCDENISYPLMILDKWKPLYTGWDR